MNVVRICTMIDRGVQLVSDNRIHVVYANAMVMQNGVVSIRFDMHRQITHRAGFVKIANIIPLDRDVNSVKISFIKIILYQLPIHMFVNVS